ncbi:unnamed protein product [Diamesa tonsa]
MNFLLLSLFCGLIVQQIVAVSIGSSVSTESSTKSPCLIHCSLGFKVEYINCTCIPYDASITPSFIPTWTTPSDTPTWTTPSDTPTWTTPSDTPTWTTPSDTSTFTTPSDTPTWTTPCLIYCPYFFKIDQETCTCILDKDFTTHVDLFCPDGYEPDFKNARCSPVATRCNIYCPADGYLSDYENCKCIPISSTPSPTMPTSTPSSTDEPSCLITCPVGQYLDTSRCINCENCYCIPDPNYDEMLKCKNPQSCPVLMTWSIEECGCVCSGDLSCIDGYVIDENICKCVLEPLPSCGPGFIYSSEECSCVCANILTCPPHSIWDPLLCECICPLSETCAAGFVFDTHVCDCVCEYVKNCAHGFHFDEGTCSCSCSNVTSCTEGFIWDDIICKCVRDIVPTCLPGFTYSHDLCDCVCAETEQCTGLEVFDDLLCKCICPVNAHCTYGHFNAQLCDCEFDQSPPTPPHPTPIPTAISSNTLSNEIIIYS